ncbi:MAG: hypothetical protein H6628_01590 [Calditrichae bacterium]|nr:hypothetical protein [Calditrichia bacterium]
MKREKNANCDSVKRLNRKQTSGLALPMQIVLALALLAFSCEKTDAPAPEALTLDTAENYFSSWISSSIPMQSPTWNGTSLPPFPTMIRPRAMWSTTGSSGSIRRC